MSAIGLYPTKYKNWNHTVVPILQNTKYNNISYIGLNSIKYKNGKHIFIIRLFLSFKTQNIIISAIGLYPTKYKNGKHIFIISLFLSRVGHSILFCLVCSVLFRSFKRTFRSFPFFFKLLLLLWGHSPSRL